MRDNLSQRKLLDILTSEIEQLNKTTENIKAVAPEIDKQLKELKKNKLQVDLNTGRLEQIMKDHENALQKRVVMPRWFLILIGMVIVFLLLEVVWLLIV
ncbi:hypothetical protein [Gaoshiqia sediminis]|uniref:Uncharacterized protein n=1 Tax=Gaoshiqia sediminis TaxID=2986998 RepID=A0AA41Y3I7_9BACT|nr:hypothetical protein [Gaoshiqia sediminis]MCW0481194.1 hypothetical protein [Gaoshiqia sediminis]